MLDIKKMIIPIAVVIMFFGLAFSPALNAGPIVVKSKKMTLLLNGINDNNFLVDFEITDEDLIELNDEIENFMEVINTTINENSECGTNISDNEWYLFKNIINKIIDLIAAFAGDEFPLEETKVFIYSLIEQMIKPLYLFRQPIISVGIGITFIPFYDYETFFGKLLRPVMIQHLYGFSATARFNPFILGFPFIKYGHHRIRTFFFDGLMINFADLDINRIIGPQLLLGFGCFSGFS